MRTADERLRLLDEILTEAADRGLVMRTVDDAVLTGRTVALAGRELVNFGSCSYLGLELDPRMRAAVHDAVDRYGTQFSSSRGYLSAPPYRELEARLQRMFGGHVLVSASTSLGHLSALPVLIGSGDAVLLDQQVHASVQTAADLLRLQGTPVELIRHNRIDRLERMLGRLPDARRVWYLADGVYSMFADLAPFDELRALLDRHERLHVYIDDSHGVGWAGRHGRGPALDALGGHPRVVVAASLNKSFAAAGGALIFPDAESLRRVRTLGGPMLFSGPIQPPLLGAALASAAIHLSPEIEARQAALRDRIRVFDSLLEEHGLPSATRDVTPIRYVPLGLPRVAHEVIARLMEDGFYTNLGSFPAVPMKHAGVRMTLTLHHTPADIQALVEALARHVPAALHGAGAAAQRKAAIVGGHAAALRLERHRSVTALDAAEWDALLGERGTFSTAGLRMLEAAFAGGEGGRPEDEWAFHYYVVRDRGGRPVLATFFTAALWKDDMLAAAEVSRLVEERRAGDPYYLTSVTFGMGSLLTEGDHLYLDRNSDWHAALDLLLEAVSEDAAAAGAGTIVLRDLYAADRPLTAALRERGFARLELPESHVLEPVAGDDRAWLAGLSAKARAHQRRDVLPWDDAFEVSIVREPSAELDHDHLYSLYAAVAARGLDLNTFALPRSIFRTMLEHEGWELVLLRLGGRVAAFGAHFAGTRHYAPMIVGLDYAYVRSHHSYRQALRHVLLRARELGARRVLLGMGAGLEKRRFGAHPQARVAFAQASDHYSAQVLAAFAADARTG